MSALRVLLQLCLLRRGPQDLPHAPGAIAALVLASVAADLLFVRMVDADGSGDLRIVLSLVLLLGLPWVVLTLRRRPERYAQTLAAFAGSGALFTVAILPLALQLGEAPLRPGSEPTTAQLTVVWIVLALQIWKLAINGHIWKHALDWPRVGGVLLALGVLLFEIALMRALFAPAAAA